MGGPDLPRSGAVIEESPTATFEEGAPPPEPPARRFLPGTRFGDRYRIIEMLGRGAMGEVYRADDLKLGQPVALKFLPPHLAEDAAARARIRNEVRIARQVSHPNVCRVYDLAEADGSAFISMEYVDGEDLRSVLRRLGRPSREKAFEIARQLCAGLAAAHEIGVVHRDLKSENIMIDGRGRVRITDFGLAAFLHELSEGALAGTPAYMAPELFEGAQPSARTDIYSLGAVLYELFTGRSPFGAATPAELRRLKLASPPSPREHLPDIDPLVEGLILGCLEAEPARRPASALAVASLLPGGDPVALALAAGDTPSPEAVAAAGGESRVSRTAVYGCLAAAAAGLAAIIALNGRVSLVGISPPAKPPVVLADRSRELLLRLGHAVRPADTDYGYRTYGTYLEHVAATVPGRDRWATLHGRRPRPYSFWYRESPLALVPLGAFGEVSFGDPPRSIAGMASVVTDDEGRLQILEIVPPQRDPSPASAAVPDYSVLFEAAGLEAAEFRAVAPEWNPLLPTDSRSAWTGHYPGQDEPMRVEAGAYRGRPVYFQVLEGFDRPMREPRQEPRPRTKVASTWANAVLLAAVLLVPPFVARRNVRRGVGDRSGAWRLGLAVFLLQLVSWMLCCGNLPGLFENGTLLVVQLGLAILVGTLTALIYLALEPYVRRFWPRSLISWTRLLMGRAGDPRVGRDVLFGAVAGVLVICVQRLEWLAPYALGAPPRVPYRVEDHALLGSGRALGLVLAPNFLSGPLIVLFVLTIPMLLLRRRAPAILLALGVLILSDAHWIAQGGGGIALASALAEVVFVWAALLVTLLRLGLLALASAFFFFELLQRWPLVFDPGAWYAGTAVMGFLILAAVAAAAAFVARGGASGWRRAAAAFGSG